MADSARSVQDVLLDKGRELFSGRVDVEIGAWSGSIHFADGQVLDARVGPFLGEPALWRMLLPRAAKAFAEPGRPRATGGAVLGQPAALVARFAEREELLVRLADKVGGFETIWAIRYEVLARKLDELPDAINPLVRLLDGKRSVRQVIAESPLEDVLALRILARLLPTGVLELPAGGTAARAEEPTVVDVDGGLESALIASLHDATGDPIPLDTRKPAPPPPPPPQPPQPAVPPPTAHPSPSAAPVPPSSATPPRVPLPEKSDELRSWLGSEEAFFEKKMAGALPPAPVRPTGVTVGPAVLVVLLCVAVMLGAAVMSLLR